MGFKSKPLNVAGKNNGGGGGASAVDEVETDVAIACECAGTGTDGAAAVEMDASIAGTVDAFDSGAQLAYRDSDYASALAHACASSAASRQNSSGTPK